MISRIPIPGHWSRWLTAPASAVELAARLMVASGLGVSAYVHADLAHTYAEVKGGIDEGTLFQIEAIGASVVAAAVLFTGNRFAYMGSFLIGTGAAVLAVVATYTQVGQFGPIPDLYDPVWYSEKVVSVVAEGFAVTGAITGSILSGRRRRHRRIGQSTEEAL